MTHRILVAFASRHGSTRAIAERIAATLGTCSVDATVMPVDQIRDADGYDGYVIGSAVYAVHWLGEAKAFVRRSREVLRRHPVWLFSSGPLSSDPDEAMTARPRDISDIERDLAAREHRIFAGAWDRDYPPIGVMEKVMGVLPAGREALPDGDFRDWAAIDGFARAIAGELELALVTN